MCQSMTTCFTEGDTKRAELCFHVSLYTLLCDSYQAFHKRWSGRSFQSCRKAWHGVLQWPEAFIRSKVKFDWVEMDDLCLIGFLLQIQKNCIYTEYFHTFVHMYVFIYKLYIHDELCVCLFGITETLNQTMHTNMQTCNRNACFRQTASPAP